MRVMCEGCETNFNVDDRLIKASGSKVRCSKCRHVFVAYPPLAAAEAAEPPMPAGRPEGFDALHQFPEQQEIDSNIDALFAEEAQADAGAPADQEPELLDVDDLLAGETPAAEALSTGTLGDDLRLDLDLGLDLEEDRSEDAAAGLDASRASGGEEAEIDINLDLEPADEPADVEELPSLEELELNLDDLDKMDQAADLAAAGAAAEGPAADEIELDLDLESLAAEADAKRPAAVEEPDLEDLLAEAAAGAGHAEEVNLVPAPAAGEQPPAAAEGPAAAGGEALGDELDLSDLEAMLEGEGPADEKQPAVEDADLVLDLGGEAAAEVPPADQMEELDLSDFAGDMEEAEGAAAQAPAADHEPAAEAAPGAGRESAAEADELDFTDIAGILDKETPAPAAPEDSAPPEDLDLLFDESPAAAEPPPEPAAAEAEEDLTLDLEALLEDSAEKAGEAAQAPAEAAAELDFDFIEESTQPAAGDDMEIEIEAVGEDDEADAAVAATAAAAAAGAAALQGETEAVTDDFSTEEFTDAGLPGATDILETEAAAEVPAAEKKAAPRRSGARRLVFAVLAVLVLAVAALVVPRSLGIHIPYLSDLEIPYLSELDIEIPFIGKIFQSEPEDVAGNLKIAPLAPSVTAEFIDNEKAGRLCVVKGQVQNSYDHPRSFIRVTGKLYTRDNKMARALTGYAGNLLSNQELAALDPAAITARMNVKNGLRNSNVGVKPGATVPFMLVFSNLPENLDEYSVEVAGSNK